ncbi:unnamed protein product [Lactuca virosa]|uniref:F-box associated domain-containing protein n=1 Tax=Lactuca virosa TaxID=75947 RepID=A0AAU9NZE2_9ASTR|nr:unnamed protein product [Lactuca virosa]
MQSTTTTVLLHLQLHTKFSSISYVDSTGCFFLCRFSSIHNSSALIPIVGFQSTDEVTVDLKPWPPLSHTRSEGKSLIYVCLANALTALYVFMGDQGAELHYQVFIRESKQFLLVDYPFGHNNLVGGIIRLEGDCSTIQVYEETTELMMYDHVFWTYKMECNKSVNFLMEQVMMMEDIYLVYLLVSLYFHFICKRV